MHSRNTSRRRSPSGWPPGPHALPRQILVDQEQAGARHSSNDRDVKPEHRDIDPPSRSEQHDRDKDDKSEGLAGNR
jgi:hypothetical protein